ncbi:MAG: hypothetical protein Q4B59_05440 [Lachnospiraceae bacterium]|nr:hypothetical protein [Lachnospiraceae bacterium]
MTEKNRFKLAQWELLIKEKRESGLTVHDWGQQTGHTKYEYYYWLRRLHREQIDTAMASLQSADAGAALQNRFVEVPLAPSNEIIAADTGNHSSCAMTSSVAAIIHRGDITVEVTPDASAAFLSSLMQAMRYA